MTPDDEKLSPLMKAIQPAVAALRTAATGSDAAAARAKTAELKKAFTDALPVFKARNMMDAQNWVADAIKAIDAADAAAATARWADVTAAATTLQGTCTSCHTAHRDRQDDGTFRIK
jgi:soluble cytochrome b562